MHLFLLMGTSRQICLLCIYINVNHDFPDLCDNKIMPLIPFFLGERQSTGTHPQGGGGLPYETDGDARRLA